ncbi:MAG: toprim domain-containing protein [Patescibacteria group bacterium]
MHQITRLSEFFQKFPGIGPRQARRFVYFLLSQEKGFVKDLSQQIAEVQAHIMECKNCHRFFDADGYAEICDLCSSPNRDKTLLMVVEKDADLDAVEKSHVYNGQYFVLGGTVAILDQAENNLRTGELRKRVQNDAKDVAEIILAMSANPEGEITEHHVRSIVEPLVDATHTKISILGRGLSTGTELEYSDTDTIKNALLNRR